MKVLDKLQLTLKHYSCDNCWLDAATYSNGRLSLQVFARVEDEDGGFDEMIVTATVNMPDDPCTDNEIYVKDYSENEGMWANLVKWGVIEAKQVGYVRSGYVTIERYRLLPAFMLRLSDALLHEAKKARGI